MRCAIAEPSGEVNLASHLWLVGTAVSLSQPSVRATYQQACPSLCACCAILVSGNAMNADRIEHAIKRIAAAMQRIDAARDHGLGATSAENKGASGSARVAELVNVHERLREQVAETVRELDTLLARLEDE